MVCGRNKSVKFLDELLRRCLALTGGCNIINMVTQQYFLAFVCSDIKVAFVCRHLLTHLIQEEAVNVFVPEIACARKSL